jgi:hypothetical protein
MDAFEVLLIPLWTVQQYGTTSLFAAPAGNVKRASPKKRGRVERDAAHPTWIEDRDAADGANRSEDACERVQRASAPEHEPEKVDGRHAA